MNRLHTLFESLFERHGLLLALLSSFFLGALFALAAVAVREVVR